MRFRAEQRLRRQQDFRTARERGRRIDCGGFTLWYVRRESGTSLPSSPSPGQADSIDGVDPKPPGPTSEILTSRVGVVASIASVGAAVRRNRAKRRLREIFRRHQELVPNDVDLLLVARNSVNRLEFAELERRFVETCRKLFPTAS